MKYTPVTAMLNDGREVLIRQAVPADAASLMQAVKTYIAESDYIPKLPSEFRLTLEQEAAWIQSFVIQENSLLLVALYGDEIIGNIDLSGSQRQIMAHTGLIGMGMLAAWRGRGLGTLLMQSVIGWAQQHPVLELLWLQVYADNEAGIRLYRKTGFLEQGRIPGFFRQNGRYHDVLTMSRSVSGTP